MTSKERVLKREYDRGYTNALNLQLNADVMTGTELNAADDNIPWFDTACENMNMLDRAIGFVCKSSAGRVVRLIQPYDSAIFTGQPEELPAQWGFKWSTDPAKAKPFVALSTSPYNTGECCTEGDKTYRSLIDSNVYAPSAYPAGWEEVK